MQGANALPSRWILQVPNFLVPHQDLILTTGKYLNVLRESDEAIECPYAAPVPFSDGMLGIVQ